MKKTNLEKLGEVLCDQDWHLGPELVTKAGHRFGANILRLRKGELDGWCWDIATEPVGKGVWRYRLQGFVESYMPESPTCPNCGHRLHVKDVRTTDLTQL